MSLSAKLSVALLAPLALLHAADAPFLDYPEALAQAKSTGKDIVLFQDGSDWAVDSRALNSRLADPELRKRLGDRVLWARVDFPNAGPAKDAPKPVAEPDHAAWNLPAIVIVGPDGRTHALAEGLRPATVSGVVSALPPLLDARVRRDALWQKAATATGAERARLLGSGLDLMPYDLADARRDIRDEIKKADPKDDSGYTFKYDFNAEGVSGFHEHKIGGLIGKKASAEAFAEIDARLKNTTLMSSQRQALLASRFQVCRAQDDLPPAIGALKAIIALDPRTDMARGAREYLRDHTGPVELPALAWEFGHNTPVWVPMVADVTALITAPGAYDIEFRHRSGHTRFRKVILRAGKTDLAVAENPHEDRKIRLVVPTIPAGQPKPKLKLVTESHGTGWYDGAGDIVITKAN